MLVIKDAIVSNLIEEGKKICVHPLDLKQIPTRNEHTKKSNNAIVWQKQSETR